MLILPAIDLLNGCAVRLKKGAESTKKIYSNNPPDVAGAWQKAGARYLHVVNLDGAFGRSGMNVKSVESILGAVSIPIELGGGIRSLEDAAAWLEMGVQRVIFGTAAAESPQLIRQAVKQFGPEQVVIGIDGRNNYLAVEGWDKQTTLRVTDFALSMKEMGVMRIIYTDIDRDGLLAGPNVAGISRLAKRSKLKVIASGGVSTMEHLQALADVAGSEIEGVIIGTALYEDKLNLKTVIEVFQN